ncbi:hypothetical protein [Bradyrhizobium erythrophlei]|uniref:Protease inhibitor Inh n=1 Tax=Bradyrhizobium erythrophlei TaxID=1437360 RepID=A0A1M5NE38_9BRAD|nr:hypothetical protein [Bradyrhizobium erythrophlei]SHG87243.1 hypothetical protein SAMN05443248_2936 [Bradyrhizobium erythrophlei]
MKRMFLIAAAVAAAIGWMAPAAAQTPAPNKPFQIKTRLDHLSGTQWVVVLSYLPSEITSITCDSWTMLGIGSWKHQNDFTIPAGPSVAIMDANKFDGYCKTKGSIVAHTDDGDFVGVLDRGDGNWDASTKLTFK